MKFGEKLKALRLERNLSQKALADLSGITVRTIQNYETTDMLPKRRDTYDIPLYKCHRRLNETAKLYREE